MPRICTLLLLLCLLLPMPGRGQYTGPMRMEREGIWVEQFDSTQTDKNRYTADNLIFKQGYRYVYRYYFVDSAGKRYLQRITPSRAARREDRWKLVPLSQKDSLTNDLVSITVEEGLEGLSPAYAAYHQTPILYEYLAPAGKLYFTARRGVVENEKNVWMEPPQERLFQILKLNPFPFIQMPLVKGHQWQWALSLGEQWSIPPLASWKGMLPIHHRYTNTGQQILQTALGPLRCWVIEATAHSPLGSSSLTAYFHSAWGFVLLDYANLDGSKLQLELIRQEKVGELATPSFN